MPKRIDFEAKTDRELLILNAQATNEMSKDLKLLNGTVRKHETRLAVIETQQRVLGCAPVKPGLLGTVKAIGSGWVGAILTIAALVGIMFGIGQITGWW